MRSTRLSLLAGLALVLLGAAPLQAAPTAEDRCASRMAEASGRYLDCAMRKNGRAARRGRAVNLDRCERKLGRLVTRALARWSPAACPAVNQIGGEATTLGDQLSGLVSQMSEAVGVSDEGLSRAGALCAARKAKVLGQDLRCRARALARGVYWDRPANEGACSERRLARKLARIEKKYRAACPTADDLYTLATREKLALSELTDWVAPSMRRYKGVVDLLPLWSLPDADGDGLSDNFERVLSETDPHNADTDGDGRWDSREVLHDETDPKVGDFALRVAPDTSAKSKRKITPKAWRFLGSESTLFGLLDDAASIASFVCIFASCTSDTMANQVDSTLMTVEKISDQLHSLSNQVEDDFNATKKRLDGVLAAVQEESLKKACSDSVHDLLLDPDQGGLISQLSREFREHCTGPQCLPSVTAYFRNLWRPKKDDSGAGPNLNVTTQLTGYPSKISSVVEACVPAVEDTQIASNQANELGSDLAFAKALNPFVKQGIQDFLWTLLLDTIGSSLQAWYFAEPDLKKTAFLLAWQNQNLAAVKTTKSEAPSFAQQGADCEDGKVRLGPGFGECFDVVGPYSNKKTSQVAWAWDSKTNKFVREDAVFARTMGALLHICDAYGLENNDVCSLPIPSPDTTRFHCQKILCQPSRNFCKLHPNDLVCRKWNAGRDYVSALVRVGQPFTSRAMVYEPSRNVSWLKDPPLMLKLPWSELKGLPTEGEFPEAVKQKLPHLAIPAGLGPWTGGPELAKMNEKGMVATALRQPQDGLGRRASFDNARLKQSMGQKGAMVWPSMKGTLGTCSKDSPAHGRDCNFDRECSMTCQAAPGGSCKCLNLDPVTGIGRCDPSSVTSVVSCRQDFDCMTQASECAGDSCKCNPPNTCAAAYNTDDFLWVYTPAGEALEDSWGYSEDRKGPGSCRTPMKDYFEYPYVRERYVTSDDEIGVNIVDMLWGDNTYNNFLNDWGEGYSPTYFLGAWPDAVEDHMHRLDATFGLPCRWLVSDHKIGDNLSHPNRQGGENLLNFQARGACKQDVINDLDGNHSKGFASLADFSEPPHTQTNSDGYDVQEVFSGLYAYMDGGSNPDTCLLEIDNFLDGKYSYPMACRGGRSAGCDGNASEGKTDSWWNYRQCLNFKETTNCSHLGVQSRYLRFKEDVSQKIYPLALPSGVASSTEMVVGYAVNSVLLNRQCNPKNVRSFSEVRDGNIILSQTVSTQGTMEPQGGQDNANLAELPRWPVQDHSRSDQLCPGRVDWSIVNQGRHKVLKIPEVESVTTAAACVDQVAKLSLDPPGPGGDTTSGTDRRTACHTHAQELKGSYDKPYPVFTPLGQPVKCTATVRELNRCIDPHETDKAAVVYEARRSHCRLSAATKTAMPIDENLCSNELIDYYTPSSCCDDASCETQIEDAISGYLPSVRAGFVERIGSDQYCTSSAKEVVYKVYGLEECRTLCGRDEEHKDWCKYFSYAASWCRLTADCDPEARVPAQGWSAYEYAKVKDEPGELVAPVHVIPAGAVAMETECTGSEIEPSQTVIALHVDWRTGKSFYDCARACRHTAGCEYVVFAGKTASTSGKSPDGSHRTCRLYREADCSPGSKRGQKEGSSLWPTPREVTWSAGNDCTSPGQEPSARTCSRMARLDEVSKFLELGLLPTLPGHLGGDCEEDRDCHAHKTRCISTEDGGKKQCAYPECSHSCLVLDSDNPEYVNALKDSKLVCMNPATLKCDPSEAVLELTTVCQTGTLCWQKENPD